MDKKLKAQWIKALKGGEYRQGTGYLLKDGAYCCLGVLKTVSGQQIEEGAVRLKLHETESFGLPQGKVMRLEQMNDGLKVNGGIGGRKKSFAQIADWIKKNVSAKAA